MSSKSSAIKWEYRYLNWGLCFQRPSWQPAADTVNTLALQATVTTLRALPRSSQSHIQCFSEFLASQSCFGFNNYSTLFLKEAKPDNRDQSSRPGQSWRRPNSKPFHQLVVTHTGQIPSQPSQAHLLITFACHLMFPSATLPNGSMKITIWNHSVSLQMYLIEGRAGGWELVVNEIE